MKKYFSILIFIFISFFNIADTKANVDAIALRDSILEIIDTIEPAQKKTQFLRSQVLTHIGKPWTLDLLDTALVISRNSAIREDEAHVIFDYARHYQFMRDRENFTKYLAILKEHCYKYKTYGIYLSAWMGEMQLYSSNGNTEYVIMEAQKVKDEINRLGYDRGISVVNLVLGQALSTAGKKKEAIEVYQSIVEANVINENGMMRIHSRLMGLFIDLERYDEALNQLCLRDSILKKVVSETPVMERSKYNNYWLETYLGYADIYWALRDKDNLKKYILKAKEYYHPNCFYSMAISYHSSRANYYRMNKEWDKCFEEFDIALGKFNQTEILHQKNILALKIEALKEAGRIKEALSLQEFRILQNDSLNQAIANKNEELHRSNYDIQQALLIKERNTIIKYIIESFLILMFVVGFIFAIYRSIKLHQKLRKAEVGTRRALAIAESADQLKANFLRNITYEVRIPLNSVVGFSEILSTDKDLSQSDREEYSSLIKKSSDKLLLLINNILDLSRLESGMMNFIKEEHDALQLCREAKMTAEMRNNRTIKMKFNTGDVSAPIYIDSRWFIKVITSLLINTRPCKSSQVECFVDIESNKLTLIFCNCDEYLSLEDEQNRRIIHTINELFVKQNKGEYTFFEDGHHRKLAITFKLLQK